MGEGLLRPLHLLVILAIAIFIFGPKKLPELGKGVGEGIRSFKDALSGGFNSHDKRAVEEPKQVDGITSAH
jgi:sec-independent protein translocase protein TatA